MINTWAVSSFSWAGCPLPSWEYMALCSSFAVSISSTLPKGALYGTAQKASRDAIPLAWPLLPTATNPRVLITWSSWPAANSTSGLWIQGKLSPRGSTLSLVLAPFIKHQRVLLVSCWMSGFLRASSERRGHGTQLFSNPPPHHGVFNRPLSIPRRYCIIYSILIHQGFIASKKLSYPLTFSSFTQPFLSFRENKQNGPNIS